MEKLRRNELNKLNTSIKILQKSQERDEETIGRYRGMKSSEFYLGKISELKNKIQERVDEIEDIQNRIMNVSTGLLDDELTKQVETSTSKFKQKNSISRVKKDNIKKNKQDNNEKLMKYYKSNKKQYVNYNREYNYYVKKCNSIPKHLMKNLKNMPNNKGYIFKNVYFYGYKKPIGNVNKDRMYERRDGQLYIHEIYRDYRTNKIHHTINKIQGNKHKGNKHKGNNKF